MRSVLLALVVKIFLSQLSPVRPNFVETDISVNSWLIMIDTDWPQHKFGKEDLLTGQEQRNQKPDNCTVSRLTTSRKSRKTSYPDYQMTGNHWSNNQLHESLQGQHGFFIRTIFQSAMEFYKILFSYAAKVLYQLSRTESQLVKLLVLALLRVLLKGSCPTEFQFLSMAFLHFEASFATISPSPSLPMTSWYFVTQSIPSHAVRDRIVNTTHISPSIRTDSVSQSDIQRTPAVKIESKTPQYDRGECDLGWMQFDKHCYKPFNELLPFDRAQRACSYHAANLVSVTSRKENEFIFNISKDFLGLPKKTFVWLGMERRSGDSGLHWTDGSALKYFNWIMGEPDSNGACVHMIFKGFWEDFSCFQEISYICKKQTSYPPPYSRTTELGILIGIPFTFATIMITAVAILVYKSIKDSDGTFYAYGKNRNKDKMHACAAIVNVTASIAHVSAQATSPARSQSQGSPTKGASVSSSRSQSLSSARVNPAVEVSDAGSQSPTTSRKESVSGRVKINEQSKDLEDIEVQVSVSAISLEQEPPRFQSTTSLDYLVSKNFIRSKSRRLRGLQKPESTLRHPGQGRRDGVYKKTYV